MEIADTKLQAELNGHTGAVHALLQLPDGRLATGADDATILFWDTGNFTGMRPRDERKKTKICVETTRHEGHTSSVTSLAAFPGFIASGSQDASIRIWDLQSRTRVSILEGHSRGVTAIVSTPGGWLASASDDHTIRLWDVGSGLEKARFEVDAPVKSLISLSCNQLVTGDLYGRLYWRLISRGRDQLVAGDAHGRLHWLEIMD